MGVSGSLIKIGAVFFAATIFAAVAPSKSAYTQTPTVTQTRTVTQSGFPFRGFHGGFGRFHGGFGRFQGGFGRQDFGTVFPAVPSNQGITQYGVPPPPDYGVPAQPYYGVSRPGQSSTQCYLHRHVDTPKGPVLEPVYLC